MPVEVKHGRRNGPPPSETQLEYDKVADAILRRAMCLAGLDGYRVQLIKSSCGKKSAEIVESNEEGFPLVATILREEGKSPKATLYGNLPDGTPVEVSTGETEYFDPILVYRQGDDIRSQRPWNMFFSTQDNPYLVAVGIQ